VLFPAIPDTRFEVIMAVSVEAVKSCRWDTFLSGKNLTHCSLSDLPLTCPTAGAGFEPRSGHVGFVVDKVALGQVFSEYFGLPCKF
jgi:hypothetical protein